MTIICKGHEFGNLHVLDAHNISKCPKNNYKMP